MTNMTGHCLKRALMGLTLGLSLGIPLLAHGAPFSFAVFGDNRGGGGDCQSNIDFRTILARIAAEPNLDFVVEVGDMTTGYDQTTCMASSGALCTGAGDNGNFSEMIAGLKARTPRGGLNAFFYPAIGNHELSWFPDSCGQTLCNVFDMNKYFVTSASDPNGVFRAPGEICDGAAATASYRNDFHYAFNHGNARFIVLHWPQDYSGPLSCNNQDCLSYCVDEAIAYATRRNYCYNLDEWERMVRDLQAGQNDPAIEHMFLFMHAIAHPTESYSHQQTHGGAQFVAKLSEYDKVRFVFNGHNHNYERTYPLDASQNVAANGKGIVFITTGGAGSSLSGSDKSLATTAHYQAVKHYVRVDITASAISIAATDISGQIIDGFSMPVGARADFNGDNIIDSRDLGILMHQWGATTPAYDLNDDGIIDHQDLVLMIDQF